MYIPYTYNINRIHEHELNTLRKDNTSLNKYKNFLKCTVEHLNEFQEIYICVSKSEKRIRISII